MFLSLYTGIVLIIIIYMAIKKEKKLIKKSMCRIFYTLFISLALGLYVYVNLLLSSGNSESDWNDIKLSILLFVFLFLSKTVTTIILKEELSKNEYKFAYQTCLIFLSIMIIILNIKVSILPLLCLLIGELLSFDLSTAADRNFKNYLNGIWKSIKKCLVIIIISFATSIGIISDYWIEDIEIRCSGTYHLFSKNNLCFFSLGLFIGFLIIVLHKVSIKNKSSNNYST